VSSSAPPYLYSQAYNQFEIQDDEERHLKSLVFRRAMRGDCTTYRPLPVPVDFLFLGLVYTDSRARANTLSLPPLVEYNYLVPPLYTHSNFCPLASFIPHPHSI
jgi:hypothetical protein